MNNLEYQDLVSRMIEIERNGKVIRQIIPLEKFSSNIIDTFQMAILYLKRENQYIDEEIRFEENKVIAALNNEDIFINKINLIVTSMYEEIYNSKGLSLNIDNPILEEFLLKVKDLISKKFGNDMLLNEIETLLEEYQNLLNQKNSLRKKNKQRIKFFAKNDK